MKVKLKSFSLKDKQKLRLKKSPNNFFHNNIVHVFLHFICVLV